MTKPFYTDIRVLLDRSGSMETCRDAMNEAIDGFFIQQRNNPVNQTTVSLYQFDTEFDTVFKNLTLDKIPKSDLQPRGGTALLDAMATTMNLAGQDYAAMKESDRPSQVLFIVITDGQENSSKNFPEHGTNQAYSGKISYQRHIADMIKHQTDVYKWEFIYLGANQDVFTVTGDLNMSHSNSTSYISAGAGSAASIKKTFQKMSDVVVAYRSSGNQQMRAELSLDEQPKWVQDELDKVAKKKDQTGDSTKTEQTSGV